MVYLIYFYLHPDCANRSGYNTLDADNRFHHDLEIACCLTQKVQTQALKES